MKFTTSNLILAVMLTAGLSACDDGKHQVHVKTTQYHRTVHSNDGDVFLQYYLYTVLTNNGQTVAYYRSNTPIDTARVPALATRIVGGRLPPEEEEELSQSEVETESVSDVESTSSVDSEATSDTSTSTSESTVDSSSSVDSGSAASDGD